MNAGTQLTDFFQISQTLRTCFRCMTSFTSRGHIFLFGVSIVTSLNDTSALHAREHLHSCLHLTNPCTKRKVLSLTKPKGKIYKTKSLGHYITCRTEFHFHNKFILLFKTRQMDFKLFLNIFWNHLMSLKKRNEFIMEMEYDFWFFLYFNQYIFKSIWLLGDPPFFLAIRSYHPLLQADPFEYILCQQIWYSLVLVGCPILAYQFVWVRRCPRGVMVKVMDCGIVVSEFVLQSRFYFHFHLQADTLGKDMDFLILPDLGWIGSLLFFLKNGFGI